VLGAVSPPIADRPSPGCRGAEGAAGYSAPDRPTGSVTIVTCGREAKKNWRLVPYKKREKLDMSLAPASDNGDTPSTLVPFLAFSAVAP
jgi:hypothetical protein